MSKAEEEFVAWLSTMLAHRCPAYEREFKFHLTRRWRFDFAWVGQMVAVEIEGGVWVHGRHTRPITFERDCEKYNEAALLGWTVLRLTPQMLKRDPIQILNWLEKALDLGVTCTNPQKKDRIK